MKFYVGGVGGRNERMMDVAGEEDAVRAYLDAEVTEGEGRVGVYVRRATEPQWMAYTCAYRFGRWETSFAFEVPLGTFQRVPAAEDALRAAKANVRDACATACHEVRAEYEAHGWADRATGARAAADAIAALDLEAL